MGRKHIAIVVTALAAIAAPLAMSGSTATAATRRLETVRTSSGRFMTAPDFSMGGNAGYLGGTGNPSKVKLNVTVPVIDCSTAAPGPLFVQVYVNGMLAGGAFSASGMYIGANCSGTTPSYSAQLVIDDGNGASIAVSAGDVLKFDATVKTRSESYTLTDASSAQSVTGAGPGLTPQNLQLTVQGGFSDDPTFPPFTAPIKYSGIKVNGDVFSTLNPSGSEEVDAANRLEIRTRGLSVAGDAFTVTFVRNT